MIVRLVLAGDVPALALIGAISLAAVVAFVALIRLVERKTLPPLDPVNMGRFEGGPRVAVRLEFSCGCTRESEIPAAWLRWTAVVPTRCPRRCRGYVVSIEQEEKPV